MLFFLISFGEGACFIILFGLNPSPKLEFETRPRVGRDGWRGLRGGRERRVRRRAAQLGRRRRVARARDGNGRDNRGAVRRGSVRGSGAAAGGDEAVEVTASALCEMRHLLSGVGRRRSSARAWSGGRAAEEADRQGSEAARRRRAGAARARRTTSTEKLTGVWEKQRWEEPALNGGRRRSALSAPRCGRTERRARGSG